MVGQVPKNNRGLYRVEHYPESADSATEELTLDQFHRRMGHISPDSARKLVSLGLVTGVFYTCQIQPNLFFANRVSSPNPVESLFKRLEGAKKLRYLEGRCIAIFGDLHQLKLKEGEDIISPLQMIKLASLTSTCSGRKTKPSTSINNRSMGRHPAVR